MPLMGEFRTRLYDNVQNSNDRCKNRWRGNSRIRNIYHQRQRFSKDLLFSLLHFFPLSKDRTRCPLLPSSIYSDASWKEIQRQRTTLTKEIFILGGENRDIANNGITRAAFRVLKCVAINRSKSKRGRMLLTALHLSQSNLFLCDRIISIYIWYTSVFYVNWLIALPLI